MVFGHSKYLFATAHATHRYRHILNSIFAIFLIYFILYIKCNRQVSDLCVYMLLVIVDYLVIKNCRNQINRFCGKFVTLI